MEENKFNKHGQYLFLFFFLRFLAMKKCDEKILRMKNSLNDLKLRFIEETSGNERWRFEYILRIFFCIVEFPLPARFSSNTLKFNSFSGNLRPLE
jgi:hypothetical protein